MGLAGGVVLGRFRHRIRPRMAAFGAALLLRSLLRSAIGLCRMDHHVETLALTPPSAESACFAMRLGI